MSEPTPEQAGLAGVGGEDLQGFVRQRIQGFSQELLDDEVMTLLGRRRYMVINQMVCHISAAG